MPTRREFLWTAGGAAAALAAQGLPDVTWTPQQVEAAGWAPGLEALRSSTCLLCPSRCGIRGRMVDGRLVRILGNPSHPLSQGGVCPRGIAGVQLLYHPDRLASPLERVGDGELKPLAYEQALEQLGSRLRALRAAGRPDRLAVVSGYSRGTMEAVWRQFLRAFGSPNYVTDDCNDGTDTITALMHGIARRPAYDLERSGVVLSFGAPLFDAWWSPLQAYVAFGRPASGNARSATRPHFIQVDTRFSRTAARAHEWVGIRPGTHGVLALGIAYVLLKEELVDAAFLARHVSGFEDATDASGAVREGYRSVVLRHYRTEEVSAITGVPVERIVALAKAIAERRPMVAVGGADVMLAPDGLLQGVAVHSLNVLMGSINRPGGVLVGDDPPLAPLTEVVVDRVAATGLARGPAVGGPPFGTGDAARRFAENIAGGHAEPPEVLFLYYANPVESSVRGDLWEQVLERIPYVVSFSPFLDGTSRRADLVLPDLLPYERWQDGVGPTTYAYPTWSIVQPLVAPRHAGVAAGDTVLQLARALGGSVARSLPYDDMETLLKVRARGLFAAKRGLLFGDEFNRTHYRQMEERGWWLPEHTEFDAFWADALERGGWTDQFYDDTDPAKLARTPDGRIALLPPTLVQAVAAESRGLYARPAEPEPRPATDFPLRLVPYRVAGIASGGVALQPWLHEQPTVLPDQHWIPWVEVHPATADGMGLADRAMVWVVSARGRYRARVKIYLGVAKQNVNAPYGLRHPSGESASPLHLLDDAGDPLTGLSAWFTTFVRLEPA
jgi:anaerobic selenocysteine-containing dehydrogenase